MEKILISGCFLGQKVRYNGEVKPLIHQLIFDWKLQDRFVVICPEVSGGLPVPREAAEINKKNNKVLTSNNEDVTDAFNLGAQKALQLCLQYDLKYALLKESSPSCGSHHIYDGTFSNTKILGKGITTQLLEKHGIKVYSERNIEELAKIID